MTVIGFNFSKISASRKNPPRGKININRTCKPTKVEEATIAGGQKALRYSFVFSVEYQPDVALLEFEGALVELVSEEEHKAVLSMWEDSEQLPPKSLERVMNELLDRCHVEAILMSKELGIPPPIKMPSVKVKDESAPASEEKKSSKTKKKN